MNKIDSNKVSVQIDLYFHMLRTFILTTNKENIDDDKHLKKIEKGDTIDTSGCLWFGLPEGELGLITKFLGSKIYTIDDIKYPFHLIYYKDLNITFYWLIQKNRVKRVRGLVARHSEGKSDVFFLISPYKLKKWLSPKDLIVKVITSRKFKPFKEKWEMYDKEKSELDFWLHMLDTPEGREIMSEKFYNGIPILDEDEIKESGK